MLPQVHICTQILIYLSIVCIDEVNKLDKEKLQELEVERYLNLCRIVGIVKYHLDKTFKDTHLKELVDKHDELNVQIMEAILR